jgi:5'-deoxynucleotidase YfbR-like HD superfamily hydrolase
MQDRICIVLTADELELIINAVNYERHNNDLTDDYRVDLENVEGYLTGQNVEV